MVASCMHHVKLKWLKPVHPYVKYTRQCLTLTSTIVTRNFTTVYCIQVKCSSIIQPPRAPVGLLLFVVIQITKRKIFLQELLYFSGNCQIGVKMFTLLKISNFSFGLVEGSFDKPAEFRLPIIRKFFTGSRKNS